MSARLRKEARALLPYWAGTLALVVAPYLLGKSGAELSWFSYCFGCALLGGVSFGHELAQRTLPLLLSQPIARSVLWRDKMLTLAAALATTTAALVAVAAATKSPSIFDAGVTMGGASVRFFRLVPVCVFCGAPLLTLVSGSALGGAILALAVPGTSLTLATLAHLAFPALDAAAVGWALAVLFCPVAVALGYARWQHYQVRDASSSSPARWLLARDSPARSGPLVTLVRKELRLQSATFVFALPLWGLFFVGGVLAHAGNGNWPAIASVVTGIDLLVLPLIAGAVAIGEERTLGVADWQLTLPPSARLQWLAKMLVTLPASLVIGLVVPLCMRGEPMGIPTLKLFLLAHLLLTNLALYAGSIANGTLSAVLLALAFWSAVAVAVLYGGLLEKLGDPPKRAVAMAVVLVVLHLFAFSNYRQRGLRLRRFGLQGLTVSGLFVLFAAIS